MKIVLLTTQTIHHTHFFKELDKFYPIRLVLLEKEAEKPSFHTHHPFEDERDKHEKEVWSEGKDLQISDLTNVKTFPHINDKRAGGLLRELKPDIMIVFGTGKLSKEVIHTCPNGIINLHGGDPERYRGLDSHLWAIYHNDFDAIITTLHHVDETLDTGNIISQSTVELYSGMPLHTLRRQNTEACIRITLSALDMYARFGKFSSRKQRKIGRYYSFMPSVLKEICKTKFERYTLFS